MRTAALAVAALLSAAPLAAAADPAPAGARFYETDVKPLLQAHCLKCHGADEKKIRGGLNLTSRAAVLTGGDTGPAVALGKPAESLLLKAVHYKNEDSNQNMPPAGKLPDAAVATLARWVEIGMPYDGAGSADTAPVEVKPKGADPNYWAYKPVKDSPVPAVKNPGWAKTPVDAFVLSKLDAKGLAPNGPADRVALARRATYDLTGLPPTPAEVDAFAADKSANAFEKLVDRLLASPHYGEKWGRHWLDLVRYAETNGYERDGAKPHAWRFRDYVIDSFNKDKPYTQFLREQVSGDEMPGDNRDAIIATGFYRLGVWDDEPADPQQALYDSYDDLVSVIGQGVLGMTLNCARCHDHKGDFFPASDYYKMVALVRDVGLYSGDRDGRGSGNVTDITSAAARKQYEPALKKHDAELAALAAAMKPIEDWAIKKMPPKDQLAVEDGHRAEVLPKVPTFIDDAAEKKRYLKLRGEFAKLKSAPKPHQELALSVNNAKAEVADTHVLIRGSHAAKGKRVQPGFPDVFGVPDPVMPALPGGVKSSGRRTALADWLTSDKNPMTARVMVNRVWQHHFGRGIVPTPNDFGKFGEQPTHPELLDYLAARFMRDGWTLKSLHKLILMSAVYQQSAAATEQGMKLDPANTLRWRFDMRRLGAEEVRDSILTVSGALDRTAGGPSVYPKIPDAVLAGQSVPGNGWHVKKGGGYDPARPEQGNRRSVYVHVKRSLQVPILATHDQADTDSSCPVRYTTTVPTQALGLLNGEFANEQAVQFAKRLSADAPGSLEAQVALAVRLTAGRVPTPAEVAKDVKFIHDMRAKHGLNDPQALARYALLMLNSNEFVYVD